MQLESVLIFIHHLTENNEQVIDFCILTKPEKFYLYYSDDNLVKHV